jgi:DNA-binding NarL/FixJ family response regulator
MAVRMAARDDAGMDPNASATPATSAAAIAATAAAAGAAPIRVFLAEDSQPVRERIARLLATAAMCVVGEAATPQASIAGIRDSRPDVVVLDVHLQGGTGLQVLRSVRAAQPEVAFVVFSNNHDDAYRRRYLADGASRYLDKSTEFEQLAAAVSDCASHHRSGLHRRVS